MRLIGRRLALYALTFWVAITVNFLLPHFMPGNPIQTMIGKLTGKSRRRRSTRSDSPSVGGSNKPLLSQYFTYLDQLVHGNLGVSFTLGQSVSSVLRECGAVDDRIDRRLDHPQFLRRHGLRRAAGLDARIATRFAHPDRDVLPGDPLLLPGHGDAARLRQQPHWFPVIDAYNYGQLHPGWTWAYIASVLRYAELPVISIVLSSVAGWMLGMRNMMITMVAEDFVLMSIAMGLPKRKVIWAAARNAVLPSIANLSLAIGLVVSGALLVELVFNYPGVGDLLLNAVQSEDYPLIQGIFLCITLAVLAANLLADLVYLALDPRTRTEVAP